MLPAAGFQPAHRLAYEEEQPAGKPACSQDWLPHFVKQWDAVMFFVRVASSEGSTLDMMVCKVERSLD